MAFSYRLIFEAYNTEDSTAVSISHTLCEGIIKTFFLTRLIYGLKEANKVIS